MENMQALIGGNLLRTYPERDYKQKRYRVDRSSFVYDANGSMILDLSRDIIDMEYNALNLPQRITFADGSRIDWLYTASGEKLRQTVIAATGDTLSRRDYLGPYLFEDNEFDRYQLTEGYVTPDDDFHAYIPDYQGNIVGVYNTSPNAITSIDSPLDQHTRYYPYGLPFADASNPTANRRKYGAKELTPDLGLNAYDFEARTLTPAFPAFAQPDPLAEKYYPLSPYLYCAGNPINFVDPDGKAIDIIWDLFNVGMGLSSAYDNFSNGNTFDGIIDLIGSSVDLLAAALPVVPGGGHTTIKAIREGKKAVTNVGKTTVHAKAPKNKNNVTKKVKKESKKQAPKKPNYRKNYENEMGPVQEGYDLHHMFPQSLNSNFKN